MQTEHLEYPLMLTNAAGAVRIAANAAEEAAAAPEFRRKAYWRTPQEPAPVEEKKRGPGRPKKEIHVE
jgi:hypothetical protein